jgi:hypothetical protein
MLVIPIYNMKKAYIILFLLSVVFSSTAQDLEHLKSQDTIYLVLKNIKSGSSGSEVYDKFSLVYGANKSLAEYQIIDSLNRTIFIRVEKNTEAVPNNSLTVKRKKFLKKNKENILTFDYIKQFNPKYLFIDILGTFHNKKVFYVIDEESIKKKHKTLTLQRTSITPVSYTEM